MKRTMLKVKLTLSHKCILRKETAETEYWLKLLVSTDYISKNMEDSLLSDCLELKRLLISTINTSKEKKMKNSDTCRNSTAIIHFSLFIKKSPMHGGFSLTSVSSLLLQDRSHSVYQEALRCSCRCYVRQRRSCPHVL